jgi:hypothetical protein
LERPAHLPLDLDEAATSLYLKHGDITAAAETLKVTPARLQRAIRASPRLIRLQAQLSAARVSDDGCQAATSSRASVQTGAARP